jgi:hypothetical protein
MDFGPPFGRQPGAPMALDEMRAIPDLYPSVRHCGFYVGGFNPVTDWLLTPLLVVGLKLAPRRGLAPLARLFFSSLKRYSRPPYGVILRLEASGRRDGRPEALALTVSHSDGYFLTAAAVAATAIQVVGSATRRPGLHLAALMVEPGRMLADMTAMGVTVSQTASTISGPPG